MLLDATKPQDGVNGNAEGVHSAEGADSGRATGSEVTEVYINSIFYFVEDIVRIMIFSIYHFIFKKIFSFS